MTNAIAVSLTTTRYDNGLVTAISHDGHFCALSFNGGILFEINVITDREYEDGCSEVRCIFRDVPRGDVAFLIADHIRNGSCDDTADWKVRHGLLAA